MISTTALAIEEDKKNILPDLSLSLRCEMEDTAEKISRKVKVELVHKTIKWDKSDKPAYMTDAKFPQSPDSKGKILSRGANYVVFFQELPVDRGYEKVTYFLQYELNLKPARKDLWDKISGANLRGVVRLGRLFHPETKTLSLTCKN